MCEWEVIGFEGGVNLLNVIDEHLKHAFRQSALEGKRRYETVKDKLERRPSGDYSVMSQTLSCPCLVLPLIDRSHRAHKASCLSSDQQLGSGDTV